MKSSWLEEFYLATDETRTKTRISAIKILLERPSFLENNFRPE
jgi:hypothetical protein